MQTIVYDQPSLALEAAELLYAAVNRLPADCLTVQAAYCIPVEEIHQILQEVTQELNLEDPELHFYFEGVSLNGKKHKDDRLTCVALCMLGCVEPVDCYEVAQARERMHQAWFADGRPFQIHGIGSDGLSMEDAKQYTTFGQEFSKLSVPMDFQIKLIEVFSSFHRHTDLLCDFLEPVAAKLKPFLEPWVRRAQPLVEEWRECLATASGQKAVLNRCNVLPDELRELKVSLRYFSPKRGPGNYDAEDHVISLHIGVAIPPVENAAPKVEELGEMECATLRLLSNPDRLAMLRAMTGSAKSTQELAQELGLNPGSVFRDLNNLYNAGALILETSSGRSRFTTDLQWIERVTAHLMQFLKG